MAKFPTYEEMGKKVAEKALDEFLYNGKSIREWMQIITSEDAISRQAVLNYIDEMPGELTADGRIMIRRRTLEEYISDTLPPVTPQSKTGHWIEDKCSVCGKGIENLIDSYEWYRNEKPNFCPFCGLRLVDSQESEAERKANDIKN